MDPARIGPYNCADPLVISSTVTHGASESGWSSYTVESARDHPGRSEVGDDGGTVDPKSAAPMVGLGAICGVDPRGVDDDGRSQHFWVSEFALLADGRRVILHEERGFTLGSKFGDVKGSLTSETIARNVLGVVLPDDDECGDEHPWSWLAELARNRGLDVSTEDLRGLPYDVVLTEGVRRWARA